MNEIMNKSIDKTRNNKKISVLMNLYFNLKKKKIVNEFNSSTL